MNLEEELATLNSTSNYMTQPMNQENKINEPSQMTNVNVLTSNDNNIYNAAINNEMAAQTYQQPINQPAMVNTSAAQAQAQGFSYANLEFDINKPLFERNPLERLTGDKGETFRIHLLPGVKPSQVHVHWDAEKGHNFICLKDAYNTAGEPCCNTHEQAKLRLVIPIIVYPTVQGNPNALIPGAKAELKTLVLGYTKFQELQNQANLAGVVLTSGDIFATVDNPTYKSFNFTVRSDSLINQVTNAAEIQAIWKEVGTSENILKACGKLITREEYQASYASYDAQKYKNQPNTPTSGQMVGSYTFNQPAQFAGNNGFQQYSQAQPFYNAQQSYTVNNNNQNPWG